MQIHRCTMQFKLPMIFFLLLLLQLWISRIAAASREHGMKYPVLVHNLAKVSSITTFFFVYSAVIFMNTKCPPPLCVLTEQRATQQTCYQWDGDHRTPHIPLTCKTGTSAERGRFPGSTGWWQRAQRGLFSYTCVTLKDFVDITVAMCYLQMVFFEIFLKCFTHMHNSGVASVNHFHINI